MCFISQHNIINFNGSQLAKMKKYIPYMSLQKKKKKLEGRSSSDYT